MPTVGVFAAIFDEQRRILCVKQNYGPRRWAAPGGRVEAGESVIAALEREIREETGYRARIGYLVGVYAAPLKDDIVLFFAADIIGREAWQPDGEIAEVGFFDVDALPMPMHPRTLTRIRDAFAGRRGVVRVFDTLDSDGGLLLT